MKKNWICDYYYIHGDNSYKMYSVIEDCIFFSGGKLRRDTLPEEIQDIKTVVVDVEQIAKGVYFNLLIMDAGEGKLEIGLLPGR